MDCYGNFSYLIPSQILTNVFFFAYFLILFQILNFDSPRGGISLETEKTRTGTLSKLLVTRAVMRDSGNYTCLPSRGEAISADVHVITGTRIQIIDKAKRAAALKI